jgi:hypothetical protein
VRIFFILPHPFVFVVALTQISLRLIIIPNQPMANTATATQKNDGDKASPPAFQASQAASANKFSQARSRTASGAFSGNKLWIK